MKCFIVFLAVAAVAHAGFTDEQLERWKNFKLNNNKFFLSKGKEKERMQTFFDNVAAIDEHNEAFANGEVTFEKTENMFTDMTDEALLKRYGGVDMPADVRASEPSQVTVRGNYPDSLDLAAQMGSGWKVRNQQSCGSCWTFSTCAASEYAYWRKTGYVGDLAEQQLVDCVYGSAGGCQGGWMPKAMDYIADNNGIAWEWDYPYTATNGNCRASSIASKSVWLQKGNSKWQPNSDDASIKQALYNYGVLSVCVDAGDWGSYKSGVFVSPKYTSPSCTHAVALTGYGRDSQTGKPYWTIRNSWDTWWGEKGYMRLSAERDSAGNVMGGIMLQYAYFPQIQY